MDDVSLRRLAMVTGIPVPILVGENVKGLNSTGDNERLIFNEMLANYRANYLLAPINRLMAIAGLGEVEFKDNQGYTLEERASYERLILDNALILQNIGEDAGKYLEEKGLIKKDSVADFFIVEDLDA
jgi:hypothetical protein